MFIDQGCRWPLLLFDAIQPTAHRCYSCVAVSIQLGGRCSQQSFSLVMVQASTTPRLRLPSFQLPNMPSGEQPTRGTLPHNVLISGPINACCPHHACHAQLRQCRNKRYQIGYGTHQVQSAKPSFRCLFPAPRGLPRLVLLGEKAGGALTGWKQRNRAHRGIQNRRRPGAISLVHDANSVTIQPPIQGITAESFNACQAAVLALNHQSSPFPFLSATAYIEWILLSY